MIFTKLGYVRSLIDNLDMNELYYDGYVKRTECEDEYSVLFESFEIFNSINVKPFTLFQSFSMNFCCKMKKHGK